MPIRSQEVVVVPIEHVRVRTDASLDDVIRRLEAETGLFDVAEVAAADPNILRVYQEDTLFELIRLKPSINRVRRMSFRIMVPELTDIPITEDALLLILANPLYTRRVFSPRPEPMAGNGPVTQDVTEN